MTNPPNFRNGWYDDGSQIKSGQKKCPNCQSTNFVESISREKCYSCGLECDYWGGGANAVYESMMDRHYAEQKERQRVEQEELDQWYHRNTNYDDT